MTHRAALYRVRVRAKRSTDWQLLGDYDAAGTWLGTPIGQALANLSGQSSDVRVTAQAENALHVSSPLVGYSLVSGRSGVTSVIDKNGVQFDRTPRSRENMRSAVLFDLPRNRKSGKLAVHVPDGRSCKGIVDTALSRAVSDLGYVLTLAPIVPESALREAVDHGLVEKGDVDQIQPDRRGRLRRRRPMGQG